jgi:hypothetical protein
LRRVEDASKPVSTTAYSFDQRSAVVAQGSPECRNVLVEIVFFDDGVGPGCSDQGVFADKVAALPDESAEYLKCSIGDLESFSVPE